MGGEDQGYDESRTASEKEPAEEPEVYPIPPLEALGSPDALDTIIVRTEGPIDVKEVD